MGELTVQTNVEAYRASTDAASLCREIVMRTVTTIQGRKYVPVEGWQAIAVAHGCAAAARDVERVDGGFRAIGEVRRMIDGQLISQAEGFVGEDEPTWFGGDSRGKALPKRPDYAIRAMAQTRAISRACRSAFSHVVVMMAQGLETTPAEEIDENYVLDGKVEWPEGPAPNKTQAEKAFRKLQAYCNGDIPAADFEHAISERSALLAQFRLAGHAWWAGEAHGETFESIPAWIERRRSELAKPADTGALDALIASMETCGTKDELAAWAREHGDTIEGLPDVETRRFNAAYDAHGAALQANEAMRDNPAVSG